MSAPPTNKWVVAISLAFGSIMATIDTSIVNVALPHIRGSVERDAAGDHLDLHRATSSPPS